MPRDRHNYGIIEERASLHGKMDFEHDIMISYAWRDNQPPPLSESDGWVSDFQAGLEFWLKQVMPKPAKVWRDKNQMPGNKVFAEELDKIVAQVAVLLTVVSEPYLSSEWCARELENFVKHAHAQGGLEIDNNYRIFKVNKLPVDRKAIPESLSVVTGFDFYEIDPETRMMAPIDPSFGDKDKQRFIRKVYDVAVAMSRLLKAMQAKGIQPLADPATTVADAVKLIAAVDGASDASTTAQPPQEVAVAPTIPKSGPTIYLPHTSRDLREVRDDLVSELQRRGCTVVPTEQPAWVDADDFKQSFAQDIASADFAIHLIGARYGSILEGETRSVIELQTLLAADESRKRGLRRLIWLPKDMGEINAQQSEFLTRLRNDRNALDGADMLEDTVENLKSSVLNLLKPKPLVATTPEDATGTGSVQLYLMHDVSDKDAVRDLRKLLKGKLVGGKSVSVILPVFEGAAAELRDLQRQKLCDCDAVLLFWGASSPAWIDASLNEIRKARGFGRTKKFLGNHLVILAGDKTSSKNDWLLDFKDGLLEEDVQTLEAWAEMSADAIDNHLKTLG
jgi:Domain of unknown function (DUF4062)/TIR domain